MTGFGRLVDEAVREEFVNGYLNAALALSSVDASDGSDQRSFREHGYTVDDIDPATLVGTDEDVGDFLARNAADVAEALSRGASPSRLGEQFWLNRCGHGTGFWDDDLLEEGGLGERLSAASKLYSEDVAVTLGPDGDVRGPDRAVAVATVRAALPFGARPDGIVDRLRGGGNWRIAEVNRPSDGTDGAEVVWRAALDKDELAAVVEAFGADPDVPDADDEYSTPTAVAVRSDEGYRTARADVSLSVWNRPAAATPLPRPAADGIT